MLSKIFVFKLIVLILALKLNLVSGLSKKFCKCQTNVKRHLVDDRFEVYFNQYPWMASVTDSSYHKKSPRRFRRIDDDDEIQDHKCTAFILNESWVITTKTCTANKTVTYSVGFGYDKVKMFGNKIRVRQIIPHNDENIDMSLLELEEPLKFDEELRPVCLDTKLYSKIRRATNDDIPLIATGYGIFEPYRKHKITGEVKGLASNYLTGFTRNLKKIPMLDKLHAQSDNPWELSVYDAQEGNTVCLGDEGGPLHYTHLGQTFVVGLLSKYSIHRGPRRLSDNFYYEEYCRGFVNKAIYHKISPQIEWIKGKLGENNYCDDVLIIN